MDSRTVLVGYAAVVAPVGLFVALWGTLWIAGPLDGVPDGLHSVVRMIGTVILGAGLMSLVLSRIGDPLDRRRCLLWFSIAHAIVLLMAFTQSITIWDQSARREPYWLVVAAGVAFIWLLFGWVRQGGDPEPLGHYLGLFGTRPTSGGARLKSQYEQQMRQAGAQEERNRLARDLHDSVKQQIFAIQTAAATAEARFSSDPDGSRAALAQVRDAARDSMAEMDAMLDQLSVTPIENAGLVGAIRQQCEAVRLRTGAAVDCDIGPLPPNEALQPGVHLALFRAAQEALSNVARHARASRVRVALGRSGSRLELRVSDDGSGYRPDAVQTGMGLQNIRARASEFGGEAHIGSQPGQGTTVFISIPFADADPAYYLKRASIMFALVLFFGISTVGRWPQGRGRYTLIIFIPTVIDTVRYLIAWRRAKQLRAAVA
jgi:signal transduction histidine kinase